MNLVIFFIFLVSCSENEVNSSLFQRLSNKVYMNRMRNMKKNEAKNNNSEVSWYENPFFTIIFEIIWVILILDICKNEFKSFKGFQKYYRHLTPGVKFLISFIAIVHLFSIIFSFIESYLFIYWFSINPFFILEQKQYWRAITGQIIHTNAFHCFSNLLEFFMAAQIFEKHVGTIRFIFFINIIMITITILYVLIHYLMYLSIYDNHFGYLSVGFSGVVFSMYPIARSIIEKERRTSIRMNLASNGRSSPSPSPIIIFNRPYPQFISIPNIEWILLVVTSLIIPNASFLVHLLGIIVGHLYVFLFEKSYILSINEGFALIFITLFPIFVILYFISYLIFY